MQTEGSRMKMGIALEQDARRTPSALLATDDELNVPAQESIARLAYSYWEARGGGKGSAWEDWFRAEDELKRRNEL